MVINVKDFVKEQKDFIKQQNVNKKLLILQVGNDKASNAYIKGKITDCAEVGFSAQLKKFDIGEEDAICNFLSQEVNSYNGIILQKPCYMSEENEQKILSYISQTQDIDGFKKDSIHNPCTPSGIIDLLKWVTKKENFKGVIITVVGKGPLVGFPLVPMLMREGATVISCNSSTPSLSDMTLSADIVISAVGKENLITSEMIKPHTIVIDAGITFDSNGKMCGDCNKNMYNDEHIKITSVPGGVGLVTRTALLKNLLNT